MAKSEKTAREIALGMLARREHAVEELWRKLMNKEVPGGEARRVVDALKVGGQVNDARYAAGRARYRALVSRWGATRIRQELMQAGVDKETVDSALAGLPAEDVVFAEEAVKAARKRFRTAVRETGDWQADPALDTPEARLQRVKARQKKIAYLVRRGFSFAEAQAAVQEVEDT